MVEGRLALEPEVQQIFDAIDQGRNFLLSGGAGSGKTYSLVQVIRQALQEHPNAKVACMTYTNAAVKEIEERVNHENLSASTIHDFLWDNIKLYQKELKKVLIDLINDETVPRITMDGAGTIPDDYFEALEEGIQYKEFLRISEGIISHDELLVVAHKLFENYPRLNSIVKDRYKFIFIDEYQDTHKIIVEIFLIHFRSSNKKNTIGFFGDAMQSIYENRIGNLDEFKGIEPDRVLEIRKTQNRRSPRRIIELANRLRTDSIIQEPSSDPTAPNMIDGNIKEGNLYFLYSSINDLESARQFLRNNRNWDFENPLETKELNLTHNLIADKAGFRTLMDIYDRDPILALKKDILDKIKNNGEFAAQIDENDTFDQVVDKAQLKNRQRQLKKDLLLSDPITAVLYNKLSVKPFSEVRRIYVDKEALIDDKKQDPLEESRKGSKRDHLIRHLYRIQTTISLYQEKKYNEFLRATDYRFRIKKNQHKRDLKAHIENLVDVGEKTIDTIITEAHENGICVIDDRLIKFQQDKEYLYNRVKEIKFREFQELYKYLEGHTPFSTQHKTKGAEFDNVLVSLDNGGWNNYNFEGLFTGSGNENVLERTAKLFYVCCTRSKENLAVFFHEPNQQVITQAKSWFGLENVINLDSIT